MDAVLILTVSVPLALAALAGALHRVRAVLRWAPVAASAVVLACGLALLIARTVDQESAAPALWGVLRADALSAFVLTSIGAIGLIATWAGVGYTDDEPPRDAARYSALLCAFLGAMSLAVVSDSVGLMWMAVEATTIATAFLVGHHQGRLATEAAWKYVILGSVGVAIAFLGVVLLYAASIASGGTLSWLALSNDGHLEPGLVRLGAALAILGFATKAGLAPMHSWLPDAHGQAPAPVSALMSGVLLSVALYAILRIQAIADHVLGPALVRGLLIAFGLLSLALSAALLLRQRDFKRMLAYSSIEHMGVMALGVAIGRPALPAVLLYVLAHGLVKASLFVLSGRLLAFEGSTSIAGVHALLARRPAIGVPWLLALAALLGFPPGGLFFAELGIVLAGWQAGLGVVFAVALALITLAFGALVRLAVPMLFGAPSGTGAADSAPGSLPAEGDEAAGSSRRAGAVHGPVSGPILPIGLALAACVVVPFLAGPVGSALTAATTAVAGSGR